VVLSRQTRPLIVTTDDQETPKAGDKVGFRARLQTDEARFQFRFHFGDGGESGWSPESHAAHTFAKAGTYTVSADALRDGMMLHGEMSLQVDESPAWTLWATVGTAIIGVGAAGGLLNHKLRGHRKSVRAVVRGDPGTQELKVVSRKASREHVRIRVVQPRGESRVVWTARREGR
jgi:hypothetical protein